LQKLTAEFAKDTKLFFFDDKIDELVSTFPKDISVVIKIDTLHDKFIATLLPNPDINSNERKVWEV
jgi:hypothetical protein